MTIEDDVKRITESLLEAYPTGSEVVVTIRSVHYLDRLPDEPYYQQLQSVPKMIQDGVLKLIEPGEDGQVAPSGLRIHSFPNFKVSFVPKQVSDYLNKFSSERQNEPITTKSNKIIYRWKEQLTLNESEATLQYKGNPPIPVSFTREIKMLRLLMQTPGEVVYYLKIADKVGVDVAIGEKVNPNSFNKGLAESVQKVRQDLIDNFLIPSGMPDSEARSMIVNVRSSGYKLG